MPIRLNMLCNLLNLNLLKSLYLVQNFEINGYGILADINPSMLSDFVLLVPRMLLHLLDRQSVLWVSAQNGTYQLLTLNTDKVWN